MVKSKKSVSMVILSVLVLMISLLLAVVNVTSAYFSDNSSSGKTIYTVINTAEANLNVYQKTSTGTTKIEKGENTKLYYDESTKLTNKIALSSLPAGYTQLEYIESTGTQNISTNYVWKNETTKVYLDAAVTVFKASTTLFGAQTTTIAYAPFDRNGTGVYEVYAGTTNFGNVLTVNKNERFNTEFSTNSSKMLSVKYNGKSIFSGTYSGTMVMDNVPTNIFSNNMESDHYREIVSGMKCYAFKMWDNNVLVRELVPAKDVSGSIGMYDLVENKFYTNAGTGTFVAGPQVNHLELILKNEDLGTSFGVRYKVDFYAVTPTGKVKLDATISGMTAPTSTTNGFKLVSGYYYYQNNAGTNVVFEPANSESAPTEKYLMTGFSINYNSTTSSLLGGNAIYMEITIENVNIT